MDAARAHLDGCRVRRVLDIDLEDIRASHAPSRRPRGGHSVVRPGNPAGLLALGRPVVGRSGAHRRQRPGSRASAWRPRTPPRWPIAGAPSWRSRPGRARCRCPTAATSRSPGRGREGGPAWWASTCGPPPASPPARSRPRASPSAWWPGRGDAAPDARRAREGLLGRGRPAGARRRRGGAGPAAGGGDLRPGRGRAPRRLPRARTALPARARGRGRGGGGGRGGADRRPGRPRGGPVPDLLRPLRPVPRRADRKLCRPPAAVDLRAGRHGRPPVGWAAGGPVGRPPRRRHAGPGAGRPGPGGHRQRPATTSPTAGAPSARSWRPHRGPTSWSWAGRSVPIRSACTPPASRWPSGRGGSSITTRTRPGWRWPPRSGPRSRTGHRRARWAPSPSRSTPRAPRTGCAARSTAPRSMACAPTCRSTSTIQGSPCWPCTRAAARCTPAGSTPGPPSRRCSTSWAGASTPAW